jgi:hypothetical protein
MIAIQKSTAPTPPSFLLMRLMLLFTILCVHTSAFAQFDKVIGLRVGGHFDFLVKAPSHDDAGFGLNVDIPVMNRNKFHALITAHIERLLGDKSGFVNPQGRLNKASAIHGVQAGPEYFVIPDIAISVQYGIFWHSINEVSFNSNDGYRVGITFLPGKSRAFVMQISRTSISRPVVPVRYYTFGLGYRLF